MAPPTTKKGKAGVEEIGRLMENYRSSTPKELAGEKVLLFSDYQNSLRKNFKTNKEETLDFEKSNVLQFTTENGSTITVRPSGTEPKIKYYFGVIENSDLSIEQALNDAELHLDRLEKAFV